MEDGSKTILVVEDDKKMQDVLVKKLVLEGYGVLVAGDGEAALRIIQDKVVNLILLDVLMPKMDGGMFLKELSETSNKNVPVVVLTNLETVGIQSTVREILLKANSSLDDIVESVKRNIL